MSIFQGIRGFYKGITASYMGISETVVHFVLYEGVKARLMAARIADGVPSDQRSPRDFLEFMGAGAFSKTVASCIAYPHGMSFYAWKIIWWLSYRSREVASELMLFLHTPSTPAFCVPSRRGQEVIRTICRDYDYLYSCMISVRRKCL